MAIRNRKEKSNGVFVIDTSKLSGEAEKTLIEYRDFINVLKDKSNYNQTMIHQNINYIVSNKEELINLLNSPIVKNGRTYIKDSVLESITGKKEYIEEIYKKKDKLLIEIKNLDKYFFQLKEDEEKEEYKRVLEEIFYKKLLLKRIIHHEFAFFKTMGATYYDREYNRNIDELKKNKKYNKTPIKRMYIKGAVVSQKDLEEEMENFNIYIVENLYKELEWLNLNRYKFNLKTEEVTYLREEKDIFSNMLFASKLRNHHEMYAEDIMVKDTLKVFKSMIPDFESEMEKGQNHYNEIFGEMFKNKNFVGVDIYENVKKWIVIYLQIRNIRTFFDINIEKDSNGVVKEVEIKHNKNTSVVYLDEKKIGTSLIIFNKICLELNKSLPSEFKVVEVDGNFLGEDKILERKDMDELIKNKFKSIKISIPQDETNEVAVDYLIKNLKEINIFWGKLNVRTDWDNYSISKVRTDDLDNILNKNRGEFLIESLEIKNKNNQKEERLRRKI